MRISKVHEMVKDVLTAHPETRDNDELLLCKVIATYFNSDALYQPFILTIQDSRLPKIESVGRARRKCQELYPELRASDNTEAAREIKEEEYDRYARHK